MMDSPERFPWKLAQIAASRLTRIGVALVALTLLALLLASCGGSGGGSTTTTVAVTVSPASPTIAPGGTQQFTASVTGTSDQEVLWTASGGSITATGLYSAPGALGTYTVTATSVVNPAATATATIVVSTSSGVTVTLTPTSPVVGFAQQVQFAATVNGSSNTGVVWTASQGTITQTGLFTAPSAVESCQVTATSAADSRAFARTTVSVVHTGAIVSISPGGATIGIGEQQTFTSTVTGVSNTGVTWTATGGTITGAGVYTAGSTPGTYSVTATSVADTTRSATVPVTVNAITLTISPTSGQVLLGGTVQFTSHVTGSVNTGVTWATTYGTITSGGLLSAPSVAGTATVTATSKANTNIKATATIAVVPITDLIYDFESAVPNVWSSTTTSVTPVGAKHYLGQFGTTQTATLSLANLSPHSSVLIEFDLYVLGNWDGTATNGQFTVKTTSVAGTQTPFLKTFSNLTGDNQTYPNGASVPPGTGAVATNSLGYSYTPAILYNDAVYHVSLTVADTSTAMSIAFTSALTSTLAQSSWGLDNVHIHATP